MAVRRLIPAIPETAIVSVNPGLCSSGLTRDYKFEWNWPVIYGKAWRNFHARTSEQGARNITTAAVLPQDSHEVNLPSMPSTEADLRWDSTTQFWDEVVAEMERVAPRCTQA
jgi:hypothetical protein